MANVQVFQRHAHLAGAVRLEFVNGREGISRPVASRKRVLTFAARAREADSPSRLDFGRQAGTAFAKPVVLKQRPVPVPVDRGPGFLHAARERGPLGELTGAAHRPDRHPGHPPCPLPGRWGLACGQAFEYIRPEPSRLGSEK